MSDTQAVPTRPTVRVPANRLRQSPKNVRRTHKARKIESLAASILCRGLLQNLVVSVDMAEDGEVYPVDAGERRRLAIGLLVERGKIPEDWPVAVCIVDEADRTPSSAAENILREGMHPADQYEAFSRLAAEGCTLDQIADEYSVTPLVVERRLGLARAAPSLLDLLRADEITTEQLSALCATDDHERQESVWRNAPTWDRTPYTLRRAVLAGDVATSDPRVAFVGGVEAFIAAGGEVRRDLFSGEGEGGFITDMPRLVRLVAEKLEATADAVRAEGWGWVEVWPEWMNSDFYRLGRIAPTSLPLDDEASATLAALGHERATLHCELDALMEEVDTDEFEEEEGFDGEEADEADAAEEPRHDDSDPLDAVYARMEEVDAEIAMIERAHLGYEPEALAAAGAVVGIERGKLRVERGLVRTVDRVMAAAAIGNGSAVVGGRETQVGGRKGDGLSDALTRSLFGYRNLAAQTATAAHPHVAKALLACWIIQTVRHRHSSGVPVDLRISDGSGTRTQHPITDEGGEAVRAAFDQLGADLLAPLPTDPDALWDTLIQSSAADLDVLIAFAVASSVSLDRKHTGLTARLLDTLGFDMADYFVPTAANYLGRVSKAQIIDAMTEAKVVADDAQRSTLLGLKKGDLAARAQSALAETRWVPAAIRTPGARPAVESCPAEGVVLGPGTEPSAEAPAGPAEAAVAEPPAETPADAVVAAPGKRRKRSGAAPSAIDGPAAEKEVPATVAEGVPTAAADRPGKRRKGTGVDKPSPKRPTKSSEAPKGAEPKPAPKPAPPPSTSRSRATTARDARDRAAA
jgi:ParB family chromosome partitioning protein